MKILKIDKNTVQVELNFEEVKIMGHSIACQIDSLNKAGFVYNPKPYYDFQKEVEEIEDNILELGKK